MRIQIFIKFLGFKGLSDVFVYFKKIVHLQLLKGMQCSKLVCERGTIIINGRYIMIGVPMVHKKVRDRNSGRGLPTYN